MTAFDIPDPLRERIVRATPGGAAWLDRVPELLATVADEWGIEVGYAADSASPAVIVRGRRDGEPVMLKLWPDHDRFVREERVLRAAHGRGYAHLLASDAAHQALLLEALGPVLDPVQVEARGPQAFPDLVTTVLKAAWSVPLLTVAPTGPEEYLARGLLHALETLAPPADCPNCTPAVERALLYAHQRLDDPSTASEVVLHGDPTTDHFRVVTNKRPGADAGYVLISPQGRRGPREFDLGVLLRDATRPLLRAEDAVVLVRGWCAQLAELTDSDAEVIWQWAYVQRVVAGLELAHSPEPLAGRLHLQTAMALINRSRR